MFSASARVHVLACVHDAETENEAGTVDEEGVCGHEDDAKLRVKETPWRTKRVSVTSAGAGPTFEVGGRLALCLCQA